MKLKDLIEKYKNDLLSISIISAGQLASGVIEKTPIQFGSAKASWNASINKPEVNNVILGKGQPVNNNNYEVANKLELGDDFYLTNGLPYIRRLEYTNHSPQSTAMVSRTRAEWQQIVDDAVKSI